ncbi:MAG: hypothetical protein K2Z81_08030, partial [Cyanobacteria bacterium]|nr:hypothetical protein [Cyanobacteriota bacterium]
MSNIWNVLFDEYVTTPYDSQSLQDKLNEIDSEKRRQEFDQALMNLAFGGEDRAAGPRLLRNLVESADLLIPIDDEGSFRIRQIAPGAYRLAIGENQTDKGKKGGRGGRLLPVYSEHPNERMPEGSKPASKKSGDEDRGTQAGTTFKQMSGAELVGLLIDTAHGIEGLLLYQKDNPPLELNLDYFGELQSLVPAIALEAILAQPGPAQIEPLLQASFLVNMRQGTPETNSGCKIYNSRFLVAYTHKDKLSSFEDNSGVETIKGEALFRMLAENSDYDGLLVNPTSKVGAGSQSKHRLVLSPGFAHNILKGIDIRPGVAPLPARSYEEVKLWLSLAGFPGNSRKLIDAPLPDSLLVRATVPDDNAWTMEETDGSKDNQPGPLWSPVFGLPLNAPPPVELESWSLFPGEGKNEYGKGATRILCAGLMATLLNPRWNSDPKKY